jgi:hypothetical protein
MTRHKDHVPEHTHDPPERESPLNGRLPAKITEQGRRPQRTTPKRERERELTEEEEHIIQEAACYCLHHFPMLWTTEGVPEERRAEDGSCQWMIRVYLRYPTGHEGYLGDLLYDGKQFAELTDREIMRERAKTIAADPERTRQGNE